MIRMGRREQSGGRVAAVNGSGLSWRASGVMLWLGCALSACDGSAVTPAPSDGVDAGGQTTEPVAQCGDEAVPFMPVFVQATEGLTTEWSSRAPAHVRFVERGVGLPPGGTHGQFLQYGDQVGWLRLGEPVGDAGAGDAGAGDAAAAVRAPAFIVGPRALVDLPVADGEELVLSVQYAPSAPLYLGAYQVVLEQGDRVVLFHEDGFLGSPAPEGGFRHTAGTAVCQRASSCLDSYRSELQVTVPGGATASLAPGQTETIGGYQVSHGKTESVIRHQPNTCVDVLYDSTYSEMTAVLMPVGR